MYKFLTTILLLFCITKLIAQDTLYFDKDWKESTKISYEYYRLLPLKKVGELLYIQDYHKNGQLQMQGYVLAENPDSYVGDIYWYDENGLDHGIRQYLNNTAEKNLTYYNGDGSIWQTIAYSDKGEKHEISTYLDNNIIFTGYIDSSKKLSGTFSTDYYATYHLQDYARSTNDIQLPTTVEAPLMVETTETASSPKPAFKIMTPWQNGRKAQETTYTYSTYGFPEKLNTISWTKDGQLLSDISYPELQNDIDKVYKEVTFYRQNNFATGIIGIVPMKNNSRHGQSVFYYPNGRMQTEEQYTDGEVQQIKFYHKDGTLDTISTYKDGSPFDGKFSDILGNKEVVYSMTNGRKQGYAYTRNIHTNEIFAAGEYRDDEPFEGSFLIFESGYLERRQFKNGKQDGLQIIYHFDDPDSENIHESYEMKDGIREGFRKIYENGNPKFESVYKNGKIASGTIFEDQKQSTFQDGNLLEIQLFSPYNDEKPISIEKYANDELVSVTYYDFTIAEKQQDHYTGIYKNGRPYEGYFKLDTLIDNIPLIDYYEHGELKYKYAFEFLDQLESYEHYTYDRKAMFRNGKILDGPIYKLVGRERLITTHYRDGQPIGFDANLFAMHYFNRISFKKENNVLSISEVQSPVNLKIAIEDNSAIAKLYEADSLLQSSTPQYMPKEGSPHSVTVFYAEDNQIKKFISTVDSLTETINQHASDHEFFYRIFYSFPVPGITDIDSIFNRFLENFQQEHIDEAFEVNINSSFPVNEKNYVTSLEYDTMGKAYQGIDILLQNDNSFQLKVIHQGKVIEVIHVNSLNDLLANDKAILRKLENEIYKME